MEIHTVASSPCGPIVLPCRDKPFKDKSVIVERDCKQWTAAQPSRIHGRSIGGQFEVKNTRSRVLLCELKASHETVLLSRGRDLSCNLGSTDRQKHPRVTIRPKCFLLPWPRNSNMEEKVLKKSHILSKEVHIILCVFSGNRL